MRPTSLLTALVFSSTCSANLSFGYRLTIYNLKASGSGQTSKVSMTSKESLFTLLDGPYPYKTASAACTHSLTGTTRTITPGRRWLFLVTVHPVCKLSLRSRPKSRNWSTTSDSPRGFLSTSWPIRRHRASTLRILSSRKGPSGRTLWLSRSTGER